MTGTLFQLLPCFLSSPDLLLHMSLCQGSRESPGDPKMGCRALIPRLFSIHPTLSGGLPSLLRWVPGGREWGGVEDGGSHRGTRILRISHITHKKPVEQAGRRATFATVEKVLGGAECCSQSRCCILIRAAEAAQWPSIIHTKGHPPPSPSQACAPASPLYPQNVWAVLRAWEGGADPLTGGTHSTPSKFKQRPNRVGPTQAGWVLHPGD